MKFKLKYNKRFVDDTIALYENSEHLQQLAADMNKLSISQYQISSRG